MLGYGKAIKTTGLTMTQPGPVPMGPILGQPPEQKVQNVAHSSTVHRLERHTTKATVWNGTSLLQYKMPCEKIAGLTLSQAC